MPYTYSDANKQSVHGPSINGLREIKKLKGQFDKDRPMPALDELLEHGHTNKLIALVNECRNLAMKTEDASISGSLNALAQFARRANEIVILEQ
jgi:hypothetical protein